MKFTLIKEDATVCVDGQTVRGMDMAGLPDNLWAIQWDETSGEIEWSDSTETTLNSTTQVIPNSENLTVQIFADRHATEWAALVQAELDAIPTAMQAMRNERYRRLLDCDWTQLSDNGLTEEERSQWATYRQELRDITITQTPAYDEDYTLINVTWPTPPSS